MCLHACLGAATNRKTEHRELAMGSLQGKCVVVVGRGGGIARAVTLLARSEGARVVVAGRDRPSLRGGYDDEGITAETVDVTDDASISAFADRVGPVNRL